jgi:phage tail-like protein
MIDGKSSYLEYLPPVLWRGEPLPPAFSLGRFLLIFEKILTGLDDGLPIVHNGHLHSNFEQTIDELHRLYHSFKVRSDDPLWTEQWLAYLASWVGLKLLPSWNEYQKRKLISDAVDIYNLRGLKRGLLKYLEIYFISELKPRIAIDIGESVFRIPLKGEQAGRAHVVASGPPIIHPLAVEVDRTSVAYRGQILIGDAGNPEDSVAKIWRIRSHGEMDYRVVGGQIDYSPIYDGSSINFGGGFSAPVYGPVAIVDDPNGFYGVADEGSETAGGVSKIVRFGKVPPCTGTLVFKGTSLVRAVDMAINAAKNYVVLDRGIYSQTIPAETYCKILVFNPATGTIVGAPLAISSVIEPTALAMHPGGDYIVADAGDHLIPGPGGIFRATNIYRVNSGTGVAASLLAGLPQGPIPVFPTSLHVEDAEHILILDYGVKPLKGNTREAEPAKLWRLTIPPAIPSLEEVSRDISFVRPWGMTKDLKGDLMIADSGETHDDRDWRVPQNPHEFGLILHFTQSSMEVLRVSREISEIIRGEKPAHTDFTLKK